MKQIRTRYAPSPTGYFHIGGARSALFNYLYAKHYGGKFILRIEDTDIERNVENGIESQYNNLVWLGLTPDESIYNPVKKYEPYIQSEKFSLYQEIANELLDKKLVYRCFCTTEELQKMREESLRNHQTPKYNRHCFYLSQEEINNKLINNVPYTLRLFIPANKNYEWDDLVRGHISIPSDALTDYAIIKSNGIASYNFSNVIDDNDMEITHIIRGEEHISNTPYQLATIDALKKLDRYKNSKHNFDFTYAHLPIVVNENGEKLSKRDKSVKQFIGDYKEMGFLPIAINNFLVNLGWSSPNNKELFNNLDEIISEFDGTRISKSPGTFDFKKMLSINKKHLDLLSDEEYIENVKQFINTDLHDFYNKQDELVMLFRKDIKYFAEINNFIKELFNYSSLELSSDLNELIQNAKKQKILEVALSELNLIQEWNIENISAWLKKISKITNLKGKNLYMPLRIFIFNQEHGPEFIKLIHLFGKDYVSKKINSVIQKESV